MSLRKIPFQEFKWRDPREALNFLQSIKSVCTTQQRSHFNRVIAELGKYKNNVVTENFRRVLLEADHYASDVLGAVDQTWLEETLAVAEERVSLDRWTEFCTLPEDWLMLSNKDQAKIKPMHLLGLLKPATHLQEHFVAAVESKRILRRANPWYTHIKQEIEDPGWMYEQIRTLAMPFYDQYLQIETDKNRDARKLILQQKGQFALFVAEYLFLLARLAHLPDKTRILAEKENKGDLASLTRLTSAVVPSEDLVLNAFGREPNHNSQVAPFGTFPIERIWCFENLGKTGDVFFPSFDEALNMLSLLDPIPDRRMKTMCGDLSFIWTSDLLRSVKVFIADRVTLWIGSNPGVKPIQSEVHREILRLQPEIAVISELPENSNLTYLLRQYGIQYIILGPLSQGAGLSTWGRRPLFSPKCVITPLLGWTVTEIPEIGEKIIMPEDRPGLRYGGAFLFTKSMLLSGSDKIQLQSLAQ